MTTPFTHNKLIPVIVLLAGLAFTGCQESSTPVDSNQAHRQSANTGEINLKLEQVNSNTRRGGPHIQNGFYYEVKASDARLNRKVMAENPAYTVNGVPGGPVHSFVWDGNGSVPLKHARAHVRIDPVNNTGKIRVQWKDHNGTWQYTQEAFSAPPHPSGGTLVGSKDNFVTEKGDPVRLNVFLHGNTGAGEPVLPTIFNHLATWGPGTVKLNGKVFENPFDGPAPDWVGHTMTTVGVRNEDGEVRTVNGGIYNPTNATDNGVTTADDMEFHLVFHDLPATIEHPEVQGKGHFPPPVSFFYHLTFENVQMQVRQSD